MRCLGLVICNDLSFFGQKGCYDGMFVLHESLQETKKDGEEIWERSLNFS